MQVSEQQAKAAAGHLRAREPVAFDRLTRYIQNMERGTDHLLVMSLDGTILRQNQGKTQVLRELLAIMNP